MGSKGAKQQVTEYYMSMHQGIASSFDVLLKIIVKEKTAWSGYLSGLTLFNIDQPDLFGGVKKEGGVKGSVYFLPGAAAQVLPDVLAQRLGRSGGADAPGYRGLASLFFVGDTHRGFYWTANNPYLPGIWATGRRAPVGLTEAYALIPRPTSDFFPWQQEATDISDTVGPAAWAVSPDGRLMFRHDVFDYEIWSLLTLTKIGGGTPTSVITNVVQIDNSGNAWWYGVSGGYHLYTVDASGAFIDAPVADAVPGATKPTYLFDNDGVITTYMPMTAGYIVGTGLETDTWGGRSFCDDLGGIRWALLQPTTSSNQFELRQIVGGTDSHILTAPVTRSGVTDVYMCVNSNGDFFIVMDGHRLTVDMATFTVTDHGMIALLGQINMPYNRPGRTSFWSYLTQFSLIDGSTIRTINTANWDVAAAVPTTGFYYDQYNNAIMSGVDGLVTWRFLDQGDLDANPAHMIYEALTNTDWGMGSPSTLIDVDSFEDAGVVLFNEPLGLSMIWTRQSSIQDFIQEVLDHIQAALFVDPQTGLLTLKLIRGDYDIGSLPTIDPSNATINNFGRKLWGEIVNEISVTWTNPENEQDETVTVHDLASITTQGGVISDSRNYYGVRYAQLAQRLAARDLRSAGAPLAACDAEVDRTMWLLRPASVVLLDWPEYGLVGLVMRVTSIDYGKPGDPTLKISLIEDVFGLDAGDYVDPPSTSWEDPASPPTAMDEQEALTLPYYMAKNAVTSIEGAAYPEVLAGALGASSNADAYGFELWGEVTLPDGSTEWQSLASLNILGHAELIADLGAEAASSGVTFTSYIGAKRPQQAGFAIIGAAGEEGNELALITAAGSSTASFSRGVLDTVPKAWPAGTPVWFIDGDALFEDPDARSVGEVVEYRLLTRTSQGLLLLGAAPLLTATLSDRPWLPSRPAKVEIDGVMFNDSSTPVDMIGETVVPVTWVNRNRLLEDTVVLDWTDATVTPEDGQTTTINVLKTDGVTVVDSITGLSGTSHNIPIASFGSEAIAIVELRASRTDDDGTFDSLQGHEVWVRVAYSSGVEDAGGFGAASFAGAMIHSGAFGASGSGALNGNSASSYTGAFGGSGAGALALTSGTTAYRYFFLEELTTGNGFLGCSTVKLLEYGTGTDRALSSGGATATAVAYTPNGSFPVTSINDGNDSTFTTSTGANAGSGKGFQIDCGAAYSIDRLGYRSRSDSFGASEGLRTGNIYAKVNSGDAWTLIRAVDATADTFQDNEYREFMFTAIDPTGFNPASMFSGGIEGVWYDPSDLSTLWKDTAGTIPVTTDGDAVARIDDKSGNGHHATQSTSGSRPLYKTSGGKHWLEFDGSNDYLDATTANMAQPNDVAFGTRLNNLTNVQAFFDGITARHSVTKMTSGNGNLEMIVSANSGSINTLDVASGDYAIVAKFNGASSTIRKNKALVLNTGNPSTGNFNGIRVGASSTATNALNGRIYGLLVRDTAFSISEQDNIEAYMANKAGASLP